MKKLQKLEERKKKLKLTNRQRIFVEEYALTKNRINAALKAYTLGRFGGEDHRYTAAIIAAENLNKPKIIEAIELEEETLRSALKNRGITPAKIARKIDQLLEGEDSNSVDKGLKHALNIYGVEEINKPQTNNVYNFLFNTQAQEEIKVLEDKIKERLRNVKPD